MLLGNLVGSCQFNLVAIVGIPALINPLSAESTVLYLHLPALLIISLAAWAMLKTHKTVMRREGLVLLLLYLAYIALVVWRS